MTASHARRILAYWLPGVVIAVAGLGVTYALVAKQQATSQAMADLRFSEEARSTTDALAQRIVAYTEVVAGLRDLFQVNPHLEFKQFERVVAGHNALESYPELQNLSFVRWVPADQLPDFEAQLRQQARSAGKSEQGIIHPPAERSDYYIVQYLWPHKGNEGVWGLDIASQPANLAAMISSRETGKPTVSAPFELLQEATDRNAFLLRIPIFEDDAGADTAQPRFIGAVAAIVQGSHMLSSLSASGYLRGLALQLDDMGSVRDGLAEVTPVLITHTSVMPRLQDAYDTPQRIRMLRVHDRLWRLSFKSLSPLLSPSERMLPWWIAVSGVALSVLLGALFSLLLRQRMLALARVKESSVALQHSEGRFGAVFNQAAVGVCVADLHTEQFVRINQKYCDIVGYTEEELKRLDLMAITHPDDIAANQVLIQRLKTGEMTHYHIEKRVRRKDGQMIWIDLTASSIWEDGSGARYHIGVIQDVTERRRIQSALLSSEERLRGILDQLPVGVCLVHREGRQVAFRNRQFVQICGYSEQEVVDSESWWTRAYPNERQRDRARQHWRSLCDQAEAGDGVIAADEYEITCANGEQRVIQMSGVMQGRDYLIVVQDLSSRKAAEEKINYLAYYDSLTQLPNRRLLHDRLLQALINTSRSRCSGALLLLDIDHFKVLNETRGHDSGDDFLRQVAERLRGCVQEDHTVARYGDDEFVVVMGELAQHPEEAAQRAEEAGRRILDALSAPYMLDAVPYHATASMGISVFHGMDEGIIEQLKRADLAMYQAKEAGRNTLQFYDPHMQAMVNARITLEQDMRVGIEQGQFELHFQPQVEHGHICGAEALLRWFHPDSGSVPPATFIPLAEETGLILPLGQWVLETACRQLAVWASQPELAGLTLAVNVSAQQFHQPGFVPLVLATLADSGVDPQRLKLELTESLLLQDIEDTAGKMAELKSHGVGFSIDDFGTGYSSLVYLKRLPIDQLKIDQRFVRDVLIDPNDAAIARTIVALATSLGLHVIAEGVESEAQRKFLALNQCHAWQGYLLSMPVPVGQFEQLVAQHIEGFWPAQDGATTPN